MKAAPASAVIPSDVPVGLRHVPAQSDFPSVFDARDGDEMPEAYAVPGTCWALRYSRAGGFEVCVLPTMRVDRHATAALLEMFGGNVLDAHTIHIRAMTLIAATHTTGKA